MQVSNGAPEAREIKKGFKSCDLWQDIWLTDCHGTKCFINITEIKLNPALHTCSFQSRWHPQTSRQRCSSASSPKPDSFGTSSIQLWLTHSAALRAPRLLTKCFTLTDCSEGIRDPTRIYRARKKPPKAVESGENDGIKSISVLAVKVANSTGQNQTYEPCRHCHSQLQQNYEMTEKKFHLIVPCNRTLCFYFITQFPVGTPRVMSFQKHVTALANDNPSQETGKESLQDGFFFPQCKHYTEKKYSWSTGRKRGTP